MATRVSIGKVFVPGGMPELTYVPRTERHLETTLAEVEDNLCKLVVVTGPTKTGKTVLVRKVLATGRPIVWIDGGVVTSESDFWHECLRALDVDLVVEREAENSTTSDNKIGGGGSAKLFGVGLSGSAETSDGTASTAKTRSSPTGKDEQILHVTDPFFAFFLKWARDYVDARESAD